MINGRPAMPGSCNRRAQVLLRRGISSNQGICSSSTPNQPFFSSCFFRNAFLFCGGIHFDGRDYESAESYYRRVLKNAEQTSYDYFDAQTHLGRIAYNNTTTRSSFEKAVQAQKLRENESIVDACFCSPAPTSSATTPPAPAPTWKRSPPRK
jgi:hypothetical protein